MTALAIDFGAGMLCDGVITGQFDDALGRESTEDHLGKSPCQIPAVPGTAREDTVIAGRVSGGQAAQAAEQVADGMSAQGQNGGDGEQEESVMGRAREGRVEGIEESMDRLGQVLMGPGHLVSSLAGLSGLLPSR